MLKDINSRQKIILSPATSHHMYSCLSDGLGAEYGCRQSVEPGGTQLWSKMGHALCPNPELYSCSLLPFQPNSHQPPESNQGWQWAQGPTRLHTSAVLHVQHFPSICIFLSFLEPSSVFSHFLGFCICSYCFPSPPRRTKKPLQFSLHKPILSIDSPAAGSQFSLSDCSPLLVVSRSVCKKRLPLASSHSQSVMWSPHFSDPKHYPQRHIILIPISSMWCCPSHCYGFLLLSFSSLACFVSLGSRAPFEPHFFPLVPLQPLILAQALHTLCSQFEEWE